MVQHKHEHTRHCTGSRGVVSNHTPKHFQQMERLCDDCFTADCFTAEEELTE